MQEPTDKELSTASAVLSNSDYSAIGRAVTNIALLEDVLLSVMLLKITGFGSRAEEASHKTKFQEAVRKSFRQRAKAVKSIIDRRTICDDALSNFENNIASIVTWRDFLCHGVITKLSDERLYGRFYGRNSFGEGSGYMFRSFDQAELLKLSRASVALATLLMSEFQLREHIQGAAS